ncbi:hypothetical protein RP20_CCG027819 [Aedes albopictus]|nr:hypothetical protein RP20_CCG027819 [Aedes albopictus]
MDLKEESWVEFRNLNITTTPAQNTSIQVHIQNGVDAGSLGRRYRERSRSREKSKARRRSRSRDRERHSSRSEKKKSHRKDKEEGE